MLFTIVVPITGFVAALCSIAYTIKKSGVLKKTKRKNYVLWKDFMIKFYEEITGFNFKGKRCPNYKIYKYKIKAAAHILADELEYTPKIAEDLKVDIFDKNIEDLTNIQELINYIKDGIKLRRAACLHKKQELLNKLKIIRDLTYKNHNTKNRDRKNKNTRLNIIDELVDALTDIEHEHPDDLIDTRRIEELERLLIQQHENNKKNGYSEVIIKRTKNIKPSAPEENPRKRRKDIMNKKNVYPKLKQNETQRAFSLNGAIQVEKRELPQEEKKEKKQEENQKSFSLNANVQAEQREIQQKAFSFGGSVQLEVDNENVVATKSLQEDNDWFDKNGDINDKPKPKVKGKNHRKFH